MKFHIVSLGCAKNTVDSEMMATLLIDAGHREVASWDRAQLIIVNACAFIEAAREESYGVLQELQAQKRDDQYLVVAGCLSQRYPQRVVDRVPGIDGLIGTRNWSRIPDLVPALGRGTTPRYVTDGVGDLVASVARRPPQGGWAYLKIADGCDAACAFCAIPGIKGRQQSKPVQIVLREAQELAARGVKELVLIAQDTSAYGRDLGLRDGLSLLLEELVCAVPEMAWIRLLYAYPGHVSERLIDTMARLPQVCHYLDLPLQHAHPDVLRNMYRPSDVDAVRRLVQDLRDAMPDIALRSTFIVGYPGETEREFETLLDFLRELRFDKVGIFGYSDEEGTAAAALPGKVPAELISERYERAMRLQQQVSLECNRNQVGRELEIMVDGAGDGLTVGRSYRDAPEIDGMVLVPGEYETGILLPVEIVQAQEYDLIGQAL